MPLSDNFQSVPLSSITILREDRQRSTVETADLQLSIKQVGLLNPPIVRRVETNIIEDGSATTLSLVLVAGERRLEACRALGWTSIPVRFADSLSPVESSLIELEENIKRSDLEWPDLVRAVSKIHNLYRSLDPDWTAGETAASCSLSPGTVSLYLKVAREMEAGNQRVAGAGTVREAYNVIDRQEARRTANALESLLTLPTPEEAEALGGSPIVQLRPQKPSLSETIICEDFLEVAPCYSGPKFNFLHCDFPYGFNPFSGEQGQGAHPTTYDDSPEIFFTLTRAICKSLPRLLSVSSHIMFWYSDKLKFETEEIFAELAPQISWTAFPLIWLKSDNAGIAADYRHQPRHIYETALLGSIGNRPLVQVKADAYSAPSDPRLHPSAKPESMLRHFFSMLVDENTRLLDPTCGAGSSLRAAESLGAQAVLGIERSFEYAEAARKALKDARSLRELGG
jgi:ParB-like chromosome segregation protein Spo0J